VFDQDVGSKGFPSGVVLVLAQCLMSNVVSVIEVLGTVAECVKGLYCRFFGIVQACHAGNFKS
jgi:hypothetical protein